MNNQNIRHALSKIAWAYLLILLNFRINDLDLLPNWAGYLLIFLAIGQLSGELRNLPLLKPFCILLGIAAGVDWLALPLSGAELTGRFFLLSALVACVALYFHFQLLTDLALLADGPGEAPVLARRLRVCRNTADCGRPAVHSPPAGGGGMGAAAGRPAAPVLAGDAGGDRRQPLCPAGLLPSGGDVTALSGSVTLIKMPPIRAAF